MKNTSVYPYTLNLYNFTSSTPYVFNSSTASLFSQVDLGPHLSSHSGFTDLRRPQYSPDGLSFFLYGNAYQFSKHTLTTAFDLSTVSATSYFDHTNNGHMNPSTPDQFCWAPDGKKFFRFFGYDSYAGIYAYDVSVPFDLTQGNVTYVEGDSPPAWNTNTDFRPVYASKYNADGLSMTYNSDGTSIWRLPHGGNHHLQPNLWKVDL